MRPPLSAPNGQRSRVPLYQFQPPVGTPDGIEVTTLRAFFARHDPWPWDSSRPGRATFHYLIHVTGGVLRHEVDHDTHQVSESDWLWVRPGHAQGWHPPDATEGIMVLFRPEALSAAVAHLISSATSYQTAALISPHPDDAAWLRQTGQQLFDESQTLGRRSLDMHRALRRALLEALLLRLASSPNFSATSNGTTETYIRFSNALELHFRELHHASDYARLLNCSVRTLSRATLRATGRPTRELIDERRLIEARRLLVEPDWDARIVANHLGFTDPANFGRFFRTRTGMSPASYATKT